MKQIILLSLLMVACNTAKVKHFGNLFPRGISSIQNSTINSLDPHGSYLMTVELDDYGTEVPNELSGMVASYASYQGLKLPVFVRLSTMKMGIDVFFQKQIVEGVWVLVEFPHPNINPKLP
jgi:hypothetical protein